MQRELPPGMTPADRIVLFDGVCKLCGAWARFLIRHDHLRQFKLASVQSAEGQMLLAWHDLPTDRFDTMALIEGARLYTKSCAFLRIVGGLPGPWRLLSVGWLLPVPLRDWLYDRIALNRYVLFGKYDVCLIPTPDHEARFFHAPKS